MPKKTRIKSNTRKNKFYQEREEKKKQFQKRNKRRKMYDLN